MSGSNPFMRAWHYLEYHPEPERVLFGFALVGFFAVFLALAWFIFRGPRRSRERHRVRQVEPSVFVVGTMRDVSWPSQYSDPMDDPLPSQFEVGAPNPVHGGINQGNLTDYRIGWSPFT